MLHTEIKVGEQVYKLRLNAQNAVALEEKLGMTLIQAMQGMENISIKTLVLFIHASLQALEHSITIEKAYAIYDEMVNEGKVLEDFMNILSEVLEVSGFFKKEQIEEAKKKAEEIKKQKAEV